ncbi:hypothetical protein K488DRAFT_88942 [Vararia minispora EC-137]|uniref:Uncharacterized protein n=1 Tax=Vararia minispora EC-137 TaxID=1314806 RepID=A0ACB8QCB9_9AGAM|nr:hypothetical protein K488DRAFT_88942 [Vararia minispora EC-137]
MLTSLEEEYPPLTRLNHTIFGIVLWEIIATGSFEWGVLRGRQPYSRTVWIHLVCRLALLGALAFLIAQDATDGASMSGSRCNAYLTTILSFSYVAEVLARLSIALRAVGLWNRNTAVLSASLSLWLAPVVLNAYTLYLVSHNVYCSISQTHPFVLYDSLALALSNIALLGLVLAALPWHLGAHWTVTSRLMYEHGAGWAFLAGAMNVLRVVLIATKIPPCIVDMSPAVNAAVTCICFTRLYRRLLNITRDATSQATDATSVIRFRQPSRASSFALVEREDARMETPDTDASETVCNGRENLK